jgi:FKBP-type peptidyl-prolyl cis-trans isomerase (trigger factor)
MLGFMTDSKNYKDIVLTSLPEREMEIIGSLTAEKMADSRQKALKKFKENIEVDGFRKGNAPDTVVIQKVGEMALLEEAAEIALSEEYPQILEEHNIDAIGRPEINITKIGVGAPLEFKIKTFLYPEVKLADYKKIATAEAGTDAAAPEVTETEVEEVIKSLQHNVAHQKLHDAQGEDTHEHNHEPIKDEDLPPADDAFAQLMGFATVAELTEKVKENLAHEKTLKEKDKRRTAILEAIMDKSTLDLPRIIIDGELDKMAAQFKDDIARSGMSFEDYLAHIKKSEDDLRAEWRDTAVKRAKSQVILNTIAKQESIAPAEEDVKKEMENILSHYQGADRFRVRMYVETFMTNELVFKFLEGLK